MCIRDSKAADRLDRQPTLLALDEQAAERARAVALFVALPHVGHDRADRADAIRVAGAAEQEAAAVDERDGDEARRHALLEHIGYRARKQDRH
eukprot:1575049-Prymnesium_polylepis.1